jgi:hypothetical protein
MRKAKVAALPEGWVVSTEIQIHGRYIVPGTELKIEGRRGRFRFIKHVKTNTTEWVDVWGGSTGSENWSSFHPDKIKRVHSKAKTGKNLLKQRKEAT